MAEESTTLTIRIPKSLKKRLLVAARKDHRTLTSFVVMSVERVISDQAWVREMKGEKK